eukprot:1510988-Pyramimonas_sp.AAC.1
MPVLGSARTRARARSELGDEVPTVRATWKSHRRRPWVRVLGVAAATRATSGQRLKFTPQIENDLPTTSEPPPNHLRTTSRRPPDRFQPMRGRPPDDLRTTSEPPPNHLRTTSEPPPDDLPTATLPTAGLAATQDL